MKSLLKILVFTLLIVEAYASSEYNQSVEGITLIFNQPKYVPGDTAFFAAYLFAENELPNKEKQIIRFQLIGTDDLVLTQERVWFNNGIAKAQFIIPADAGPGLYSVLAYSEKYDGLKSGSYLTGSFAITGKEQAVNSWPKTVADSGNQINISLEKATFSPREEILAAINLKDERSIRLGTNLSIAVFKKDLFHNHEGQLLENIVYLRPEKGNVLNTNSDIAPYYFRGRAIFKATQKPVPVSSFITFYFTEADFAYGVEVKGDGQFEFPLFRTFEDEEIFYTIWHKNNDLREAVIVLEDNTFEHEGMNIETQEKTDSYWQYKNNKDVILASFKFYLDKKRNKVKAVEQQFSLDGDYEIDITRYETFNSMIEVFSNVVPMVRHRKKKDQDALQVFMERDAMYSMYDPVYIIDGVMTDNTDYVLSINPQAVKQVYVIHTENRLRRYGQIGYNGIIGIETDIISHESKIPRTDRSLFVKGINNPFDFKSVNYSNQNIHSRLPDLRTCLYWEPLFLLNNVNQPNFNFFAGDDTGDYIIQISGYDTTGKFYSVNKAFSVSIDSK